MAIGAGVGLLVYFVKRKNKKIQSQLNNSSFKDKESSEIDDPKVYQP